MDISLCGSYTSAVVLTLEYRLQFIDQMAKVALFRLLLQLVLCLRHVDQHFVKQVLLK